MTGRIRGSLAAGVVMAASIAGIGLTTTAAAHASCNPNTGCLPRPTDVMEVGSQFYAVRPRTLDIVQNRSNRIYVTDLRWSRWTGGYGIHGLILGSARGTGVVHVTNRHSVRRATIYLSRVTN